MKRFIFFCLLISCSFSTFAQKTQTVRTIIKEQQTNVSLPSSTVYIKKFGLSMVANDKGEAFFFNVPIGRFEIEVHSVGYETKIIKELLLESSRELVLEIDLEVNSTKLQQITVSAATQNLSGAISNINTITTEQIFRFPATFFDPARLAFSFSGVANTNDQANGMSIRGNAPDGLQWRLEGVEIVNPNHLSNAGTFSDNPTQTGGGTNIMSAQMLGNMNFLTGAFPADYANALSGVMDLRFRVGNNKKQQHTAQIGLIGVDLSSEGPLNKKKGSSYLFNYRYSFTGIMGLIGIDFGGESIKYQDISLNLNFPTKKIGTFSFFAMGGNSSNLYKPDENPKNWESEKDLNNIDFFSKMGVIGMKHTINLNKNWYLNSVIANSGLENLRSAYTTEPKINNSYSYQAKNIISGSSILTGKLTDNLNLRTGINVSHYYNEFNRLNSGNLFYSFDEIVLQPFIKLSNLSNSLINYNIGAQVVNYGLSKSTFIEPRLAFAINTSVYHKIKLAYGLHSHQNTSRNAFSLPIKPLRSHHFSLGSQLALKNNDEISVELYYQNLFNAPVFQNRNISVLNGLENLMFTLDMDQSDNKNQGRNYGIELNYKKFLSKGLFALINTTLYQSQFRGVDNAYLNTRFNGNHIVNLTLGKEWEKKTGKIIGLNTRIVWLGGFRNYEINEALSATQKTTVYNYQKGLVVKNSQYFRPDLRVYFKKSKEKYARTISIDIQNFTSYKNLAFQYYDSYLKKVVSKNQLGIIPMFNYRWEF